jgi:hypothetical protein
MEQPQNGRGRPTESDVYLREGATTEVDELMVCQTKRPSTRDGARYERVPTWLVSPAAAGLEQHYRQSKLTATECGAASCWTRTDDRHPLFHRPTAIPEIGTI